MSNRYIITGPGDVLCPERRVHLTDAANNFCGMCGAPMARPPRAGIHAEIAIAIARYEADKRGDPVH
jgi:hypothetical protein